MNHLAGSSPLPVAAPHSRSNQRDGRRPETNPVFRCPRFLVVPILALVSLAVHAAGVQQGANSTQLSKPISIFSQDSGAGQPSLPINEQQALRDLDELARLRKAGMTTEFDVMDASWFAPESGYRRLRPAGWPNGPDAWLARCRAAGIRPGMRIDGNAIPAETPSSQIPIAWKDSLGEDGRSLSLFEGGYLADLMSALASWYDRGVRLFLFDGVDLGAATPATEAKLSQDEIISRNRAALREALESFHNKNREAMLVVTVESGAHPSLPASPEASAKPGERSLRPLADSAQLGALTLISAGGPQLSAAPQNDLLPVAGIESDESVRRLEQSGFSLAQIESGGFTASSNADSGMHAWKDAFLLSMARGGWVNSIHGDLSLIQKDDARWIARVQRLFLDLEEQGHLRSFGGPAGSDEPYGFAALSARGSVYVVVNPSDAAATLELPLLGVDAPGRAEGRLQFSDAGFIPRLNGNAITLGPGQMAMVGYGAYAAYAFNLGLEQDVTIPQRVEPVDAHFYYTDSGSLVASFEPPIDGVVRLILRPRAAGGPAGAVAGSSAARAGATQSFSLDVTQYGRPIPVRLDLSNQLQGGTGWTVGEIDVNDLTPGVPLVVQVRSNNNDVASLQASAYAVEY